MSTLIRKSLLELLFSGSFMKRWNDKLRPLELVEMDKQGHKMIVAWLLFSLNSRDLSREDKLSLGEDIIEGGLFDYLYRLVITDIKPPVFYKIKANKADYDKLTSWVLDQLRPRLASLGQDFWERMTAYLMEPEANTLARRILNAAHLFASYSEFKLIKGANPPGFDLDEINQSFVDRLADLEDLTGVSEIMSEDDNVLGRFAGICGHLRFQKRWSQTPRVPETTVLGHMFIVASYAWFFSLEAGACRARRQNNFFTGLFHDLPELLTRDIISPVKMSAPEIADLIREYERKELDRQILQPLEEGGYHDIAEQLSYFLGLEVGSEFTAVWRDGDRIRSIDDDRELLEHNRDECDPKDGKMLKMCDRLAAFIEANTALRNGISSDQLMQACWRIREIYRMEPVTSGIHVGALLADFD